MIEAIAPFLIITVTGLFFFAGVFAIVRINRSTAAREADLGAPEGDDRHFRNR